MTMDEQFSVVDLSAIEAFIWSETELLDEGNLKQWRDLFAEDGKYWLPASWQQQDPLNHISLMYEDKMMMAIRVENFGHRLAPSMQYPLRCSHVLGNFRVLTDSATMITIKSNFQAIVYYQEQTLFAGTYTHQLRRLDSGYEIVEKRVDLINCDADHRSILIYL
jgi:3-phenylpropionate/cinnamic acid dioxygenase small subunit